MAQTDVDQRKTLRSEFPFAWAEMVNPRLERVNTNDIPFRIPNGKKLELWASSCFSDVSKSESAIIFFCPNEMTWVLNKHFSQVNLYYWFDTLWFNDFFLQ